MRISAIVFSLALFVMLAPSASYGTQSAKSENHTVENLQTAFNAESNAHARYLAFATKADQEGYGEVASLFRAAARAEQIHANNHAEVIMEMGGTPQAKIESTAVKSTLENLEAAVHGETYERGIMYLDFRNQASVSGDREAFRTFDYARNAEAEHAKLFTEAFNDLPNMRGKSRVYYVCTICGFTTSNLDFANCHTCSNPKENFVQVS